ncbi:MAG: PQQ-dependent sugar dehydrogenase, partial [Chloroflexi bacterium]|nr:PQQ-dependent sugar dehydrogenase [Chloroflexota bacterium]
PGNSPTFIPPGNPFVATMGARGEIWALGFRNAFSFAFDTVTGALLINDVGIDDEDQIDPALRWEEINLGVTGGNYGWDVCSGVCSNPSFVDPVYVYSHAESGDPGQKGSIVGAALYRGTQFPAEYAGDFLFGDVIAGFIRRLHPDFTADPFAFGLGMIVDIQVGSNGSGYYVNYSQSGNPAANDGAVFRIDYAPDTTAPSPPGNLVAVADGHDINLSWETAVDLEAGISAYRIYRDVVSETVKVLVAEVPGNQLTYGDFALAPETTYFYEVAAVNGEGTEGARSNETSDTTAVGDLIGLQMVTDGSIPLGVVVFGATTDTTGSGLNDVQTVEITAGPVDLFIRTGEFTDGANTWALGASIGAPNVAVWEFSPDGMTWTTFMTPSTLYPLSTASLATGETQDVYFRLTLPTDSASSLQHGTSVTVVTVAPP